MFRRLSCYAFALLSSSSLTAVVAAEQEFPYQATVVAEQVEVRCGPGGRFYVTGYVQQNETVTVHRHDHGGWFMVAPPRGSLSWIEASLVERVAENRGVVRVEPVDGRPVRAIVRIGSQVSDDHSYYGRDLSNGDEVTILGEETLHTQRGPVRMFKIVPPPQEFRWIKGEFVVPVSRQLQQKQAVDPYQVPPEHRATFVRRERTERETKTAAVSGNQALTAPEVDARPAAEQSPRAQAFEQLDQIDQQYAAMMQLPPTKWNLDMIEEGYQRLRSTKDDAIRTMVEQRLEIVERRREIHSHYRNFVRLTTETSNRDAQLQAMQSGYVFTVPEPLPAAEYLAPPVPQGEFRALFAGPAENVPESAFDPGAAPVMPRLNGAGIVQQIPFFPGRPPFALFAPDGRLLAYLEPSDQVRMEDWVGKASGIIGQRQFDPQLQSDLIRVQRVVPVQLVP